MRSPASVALGIQARHAHDHVIFEDREAVLLAGLPGALSAGRVLLVTLEREGGPIDTLRVSR
jgi:hypothetical protein